MKKTIFLLIISGALFSQTFERITNPFSITIDDTELVDPFLGGFNKPVPQFVDWDGDNDFDLFVTDRDGYLQYYENTGSAQVYDFELRTKQFQSINIGVWFWFYDYDLDDDLDLIGQTPGIDMGHSYVSVYENVDSQLIQRTNQLLAENGYPVNGGQIVIPTVCDIDKDGWEDLFVGTMSGTVMFYHCLGMMDELPYFQLVTNNYEDILIVWTPGSNQRHGANALNFFDVDGDNDFDLFWGDLFQPGLFFLENFGTQTNADFPDSMDLIVTEYPENEPITTAGFNVPRFADMNGDGAGDLFAGVLSGQYGTDFYDNFWYYTNEGTTTEPDFNLVTKNFFPTLDLIAGTIPTFADIDDDGDLDLFIGTEFDPGNPGWKGSVYYFENSGSIENPSFTLMDSTFFEPLVGNNIAPAFADLDCDDDFDAYVGEWNGAVYQFINEGTAENPEFTYEEGLFLNIDLSGQSVPVFGDIDGDSDSDLFIGDKDGKIHFFENSGGCSEIEFIYVSDDYFPSFELGNEIVTTLIDFDSDNKLEMVIGNKEGELILIDDIQNDPTFEVLENFPYSGMNIAPVFGESEQELFIGSYSGGLQYFKIEDSLSVETPEEIPTSSELYQNYPNPFNAVTTIHYSIEVPGIMSLHIIDITGRLVETLVDENLEPGNHQIEWNASNVSSGVYIYKLTSGSNQITKKMILLK